MADKPPDPVAVIIAALFAPKPRIGRVQAERDVGHSPLDTPEAP